MITSLQIENFKSIKNLQLDCKRFNLLIGKPNSGKSNILEALGMFSFPYVVKSRNIKKLTKIERVYDLFYESETSQKIEVKAGNYTYQLRYEPHQVIGEGSLNEKEAFRFTLDTNGRVTGNPVVTSHTPPIKFYRFSLLNKFPREEADFLLPPDGENLMTIVYTNKNIRDMINDILKDYGLNLLIEPQEQLLKIQKMVEGVAIVYPYSLLSDTLQRYIFHRTAIETNKNSVLLFEEPEAHAFPFYIKELAEMIALDESNQYFISTHNPYLLLSILEKVNKKEVGINLVHFTNYQTKVKNLTESQFGEVLSLGGDVFFNIDKLLVS